MLPDLDAIRARAAVDSHHTAAQNAAYAAWLGGFFLPESGRSVDEIMASIGMKNVDGSYSSLLQRYERKEQRIRSRQRKRANDVEMLRL